MKGIRKLFLGLILLTLFGVGFKVEAKAAPVLRIVESSDWPADGASLKVKFTCDPDDFKFKDTATADTVEIVFSNIHITDSSSSQVGTVSKKITIITKKTPTNPTVTYKIDSGSEQPFTGTIETGMELVSKADLVDDLKEKTGMTGAYMPGPCTVTPGTGAGDLVSDSFTPSIVADKNYSLCKVTCKAYEGTSEIGDVAFTPAASFFLLNGESKTIGIDSHPASYIFTKKWKVGEDTKTNFEEVDVTGAGSNISVIAYFTENDSALEVDAFEGSTKVKSGGTITGTYTLHGGYKKGDIATVKIGTTTLTKNDVFGGADTVATGAFTLAVPASLNGATKFSVTMTDGVEYYYDLTAYKDVTYTLTSPITVKPNNTAKVFTPSWTGLAPDNVTVEPDAGSTTYFTAAKSGTYELSVTGIKETPSTPLYYVTLTPSYSDLLGYTPASIKVQVIVSAASSIELENIFVNKGKTVTLSDFLKKGEATDEATVKTSDSHIVVDPKTGAVNKIKIKGDSATSDKVSKGLTLDSGETSDVTVYPEPKLSYDTTGAGSSYKQTYTVKMPKGVYHGDKSDGWWMESLSKAKLVFKASSNSDKTREVTVDSFSDLSGDEKLLKKATKELKTSDLNVIFRDLCKNDSDTISVIAYAYNSNKDKIDSEIASEKKEFTVYKIALDTSGGANYTVNGESVSDYFYGIDGVTYEIKSSGKTANAKLDKNTSSSEFGSGETVQYKVAGARTLKAVYGAGSNNEGGGGSGGNMDDYDDVPKTGESKADIWILWSVLFIAILGAGFMIWKRFGLVRAIAAAEEEYAIAEEEERIETEKKEKEDKLNMLKDLRNL